MHIVPRLTARIGPNMVIGQLGTVSRPNVLEQPETAETSSSKTRKDNLQAQQHHEKRVWMRDEMVCPLLPGRVRAAF
jgi:hypothetical protein